MVELPLSPRKFQDYALHKSLGLTVLALALLRLAWRRINQLPPLPDGMTRAETILAKATHHGLYGAPGRHPAQRLLYASATRARPIISASSTSRT
jgi:cytochrome b561